MSIQIIFIQYKQQEVTSAAIYETVKHCPCSFYVFSVQLQSVKHFKLKEIQTVEENIPEKIKPKIMSILT